MEEQRGKEEELKDTTERGATGAGVAPGNVKVVHPIPRSFAELNPNAKPFVSSGCIPIPRRPLNPDARPFRGWADPRETSFVVEMNNLARSNEKITNCGRNYEDVGRSFRTAGPEEASPTFQVSAENEYAYYARRDPPKCSAHCLTPREHVYGPENLSSNLVDSLYIPDSVLKSMNQSREFRVLQASVLGEIEKINKRVDEISTRLRNLEEQKGCMHRDLLYCDASDLRRDDSIIEKSLIGDDVWPSTNHRLRGQADFHIAGSTQPHTEPQLNNQVLPGTRPNNYYDNFRSNSQQNLLTVPKNIPGTMNGGRHGSAGHWNLPSNCRESTGNGESSLTNFGHRRSSLSRGAEFVENIGTKLRNQEKDRRPHFSFLPLLRNEKLCSTTPSPSSSGHVINASGATASGGDVDGDAIVELIAMFVKRNASFPDYLYQLFIRLVDVGSEAERYKILEALASVQSASASTSGSSRVTSRGNSGLSIDKLTRRRIVDVASAALAGTTQTCVDTSASNRLSSGIPLNPSSLIPSKMLSGEGKARPILVDSYHWYRKAIVRQSHPPANTRLDLEPPVGLALRNSNPDSSELTGTVAARKKKEFRFWKREKEGFTEALDAVSPTPLELSDEPMDSISHTPHEFSEEELQHGEEENKD